MTPRGSPPAGHPILVQVRDALALTVKHHDATTLVGSNARLALTALDALIEQATIEYRCSGSENHTYGLDWNDPDEPRDFCVICDAALVPVVVLPLLDETHVYDTDTGGARIGGPCPHYRYDNKDRGVAYCRCGWAHAVHRLDETERKNT